MSVLVHVAQRASNKLDGAPVEFAFPAGPIRGRTSTLESMWTGIPPVDLAITGAVSGRWALRKVLRRRAMGTVETTSEITIPVILAFTHDEVVVLDTGPVRRSWPRSPVLRLDRTEARAIYQRTDQPVDTRFNLNGSEWMVHGKYYQEIRTKWRESSWRDQIDLR